MQTYSTDITVKARMEITASHQQLIDLFDALPLDEQQELLVDLLRRRRNIRPIEGDPALPVADAAGSHVAVTFWRNAYGEHALGHPERLARMVASCVPLVGEAGSYLADVVRTSAKRSIRGAPRKKETAKSLHAIVDAYMRTHSIRLYFKQRLDIRAREDKETRRGNTPSELALDDTVENFAISSATAKRAIYGQGGRTRKAHIK